MRRAIKENLYGWSVRGIRRVIHHLPRHMALSVGGLLGALAFWAARTERHRAYANLHSSFAEKSPKEIRDIACSCFRNMGKNIVEVLCFPRLSLHTINQLVSVEGHEALESALAKQRGVILLTGHFGNWEMMGASLALNGHPLMVIARRLRSARIDALLCEHRRHVGMEILFRGDSMRQGLRFLKRNGILAILADVDTATPGVFVDFLGREAYTPYGPVAIALKTGAALVPMFIVRLSDNSHRVTIHKPMELSSTGNWEADLLANTQRFTSLIESYVRRFPEQWIWMHPRWKTRPAGGTKPLDQTQGLGSER